MSQGCLDVAGLALEREALAACKKGDDLGYYRWHSDSCLGSSASPVMALRGHCVSGEGIRRWRKPAKED